jgi:hypothetical protein
MVALPAAGASRIAVVRGVAIGDRSGSAGPTRPRFAAAFLLAAASVALVGSGGCGSSTAADPIAPVSGTVVLDGDPAEHAVVTFIPVDGTPGGGASATTDASGRYVLRMPQRRRGLMGEGVTIAEGVPPGRYRVVVSRRLHADGSPMRTDEVPIESPAVETIARPFSDETATRLTAEVTAAGGTFDWEVRAARR